MIGFAIGLSIAGVPIALANDNAIGYVALALPFILPLLIRLHYWLEAANAIEITEYQLPEVYVMYRELAAQMGFEEVPRLYVKNGNGSLNAFASKCTLRRSYVMIYSDLVDPMYFYGQREMVRFVLAHELGHVALGHVAIWRAVISVIPNFLRVGASVTRAQEYSADRVGFHYAPAGARGLLILVAGKHLSQRVNWDAYLYSAANHKRGFWFRIAAILSGHAVAIRRLEAIAGMERDGLNHHGNML